MGTFETNFNRGRDIVQASPQLMIDLDVEADGTAGYGSLLSIGAVDPFGATFYRELRPADENFIDGNHEFCEAHGLERSRLLEEGVDPRIAMEDLRIWTLEQQERHRKIGSVLVAFNASFDYPLVDLEFRRSGIKNPYGIAGYCVKSLAMALTESYDWRQTAKSKLPLDVLPAGDFTHHALEDAIYQQQLHYALVGKLNERN